MTSPFLTYELLTLETADPVVIRITGQKARGFPDFTASNGVEIKTIRPAWVMPHRQLWILGNHLRERDYDPIHIPQRDWPAVKQAIRELNEHYSPVAKAMGDKKEKDMKEEKDKYEFDMQAWDYWWSPSNTNLVLLRKKPKVEDRKNTPVKVEWQSCGWSEWREPDGDYGEYHLVQFRVTGWTAEETFECKICGQLTRMDRIEEGSHCRPIYDGKHTLYIGLDAREKFSAPVLLPESVYSRLDEITKALEDRANGGEG